MCGHQARTRAASVGLWTPGSKPRTDSTWTTHSPHGPQGSEEIIPDTPQGPHSDPTGTLQITTWTPKDHAKPSDAPRGINTRLAMPRRPAPGQAPGLLRSQHGSTTSTPSGGGLAVPRQACPGPGPLGPGVRGRVLPPPQPCKEPLRDQEAPGFPTGRQGAIS